ncbi:MAG: hypothetical protein JO356_06310 [Acidobacteria bacterium]|nr:hypothetical protein [Acidobacteriota bacterium]
MKRINVFSLLALTGFCALLIARPSARVFAGPSSGDEQQINPPPFDFADFFYQENGANLSILDTPDSERFGRFRQTGPPAPMGRVNWVVDNSNTSPIHNNVRILATTGAYRDDTGLPDVFFNIIAFVRSDKFFSTIEPPPGSVPGTPTDPNNLVSGTPNNARGITLEQIIGIPNGNLPGCNQGAPFDPNPTTGCQSAFEAYAGLTQRVNGVLAPSPCGTMGDGLQPCFPVTSVETPQLRQDWRVSSNRNRIDNSASFSYFSDNLLGMWVITYHWYTQFAIGGRPGQMVPTANCQKVLAAAAKQNGLSLDGTPIIRSGNELNFLEGQPGIPAQFGLAAADQPPLTAPCAAEGKEDPGGADGGPVWLVCPTIPDPTQGGIARDAFLDTVRRPNGTPIDPRFTHTFECLRDTGQFCSAKQAAHAGLAVSTLGVGPNP